MNAVLTAGPALLFDGAEHPDFCGLTGAWCWQFLPRSRSMRTQSIFNPAYAFPVLLVAYLLLLIGILFTGV